MEPIREKSCRHCKKLFPPNPRNATRQEYCREPECRRASKADSQKRWTEKPENRNYFCGHTNVQRVQEWRKEHPGYWRRKSGKTVIALQETLTEQLSDIKEDNRKFAESALQDLLRSQQPVMIGLISNFIGSALQDDIAATLLRMQQSGQDILYCQP